MSKDTKVNNDIPNKIVSVRLNIEQRKELHELGNGNEGEGIRRLIDMYSNRNFSIEIEPNNKFTSRESQLLKAEKTIQDLEASPSLKITYKSQIESLKKDLSLARMKFDEDAKKELIEITNILKYNKQA
jgi:hypothetical protein